MDLDAVRQLGYEHGYRQCQLEMREGVVAFERLSADHAKELVRWGCTSRMQSPLS
jgi:hypothetical protein